jgi:hypothetical protein
VPGPLVERIAEACFCAVLNSLDIAMPDEILQRDRHANRNHAKADWHFTTDNARIKLKLLYPSL